MPVLVLPYAMSKTVFLLAGFLLVACCVSASLLGGWEDVDVEDDGVKAAAGHASEGLSKQFASRYHHRLVKVLKAKKQIVAGTNYRMDLIVGMTNCKKAEVKFEEASECEFQDSVSTYKKCIVLVYRNLDDKHRLVSSGCILASKKDL